MLAIEVALSVNLGQTICKVYAINLSHRRNRTGTSNDRGLSNYYKTSAKYRFNKYQLMVSSSWLLLHYKKHNVCVRESACVRACMRARVRACVFVVFPTQTSVRVMKLPGASPLLRLNK